MSKAAAGMAASKQETLFLPVYGKNKMPDDPGVLLLAQKQETNAEQQEQKSVQQGNKRKNDYRKKHKIV